MIFFGKYKKNVRFYFYIELYSYICREINLKKIFKI